MHHFAEAVLAAALQNQIYQEHLRASLAGPWWDGGLSVEGTRLGLIDHRKISVVLKKPIVLTNFGCCSTIVK